MLQLFVDFWYSCGFVNNFCHHLSWTGVSQSQGALLHSPLHCRISCFFIIPCVFYPLSGYLYIISSHHLFSCHAHLPTNSPMYTEPQQNRTHTAKQTWFTWHLQTKLLRRNVSTLYRPDRTQLQTKVHWTCKSITLYRRIHLCKPFHWSRPYMHKN